MDPLDFAQFATLLPDVLSQFPKQYEEALFRSAISRLYYGILHWIQKTYQIHVPATKVNVYHAFVAEKLEATADDDILAEFNQLKIKRVESDYMLDKRIGKEDFLFCVRCKDTVLELVRQRPRIAFDEEGEETFYRKRKPSRPST